MNLSGFILPSPVAMLTIIGIVAVLCGGAYVKGRGVGMDKLHAYQLEVEKANATVAETNRLKIEQAEQNTRNVAEAYVRNSDRIERELNSRLARVRREANHCAAMPQVAPASEGADAGAADSRPDPTTYETVCEQLERDCAKTTLMVYGLQDYVTWVCK